MHGEVAAAVCCPAGIARGQRRRESRPPIHRTELSSVSPYPPSLPRALPRSERAKARSLKDKFKGVSREQMASVAAGGSPGGGYGGFSSGPATSSPGGSSYYSPASARSEPRLGALDDSGAGSQHEGMGRPKGRQALPAGERVESEEESGMYSARSSPGKVGRRQRWAGFVLATKRA